MSYDPEYLSDDDILAAKQALSNWCETQGLTPGHILIITAELCADIVAAKAEQDVMLGYIGFQNVRSYFNACVAKRLKALIPNERPR